MLNLLSIAVLTTTLFSDPLMPIELQQNEFLSCKDAPENPYVFSVQLRPQGFLNHLSGAFEMAYNGANLSCRRTFGKIPNSGLKCAGVMDHNAKVIVINFSLREGAQLVAEFEHPLEEDERVDAEKPRTHVALECKIETIVAEVKPLPAGE